MKGLDKSDIARFSASIPNCQKKCGLDILSQPANDTNTQLLTFVRLHHFVYLSLYSCKVEGC